jgi:hypothetical protein
VNNKRVCLSHVRYGVLGRPLTGLNNKQMFKIQECSTNAGSLESKDNTSGPLTCLKALSSVLSCAGSLHTGCQVVPCFQACTRHPPRRTFHMYPNLPIVRFYSNMNHFRAQCLNHDHLDLL